MEKSTENARGTVLITGAASGIGQATAVLFYRRGWNVALFDMQAMTATQELLASITAPEFHPRWKVLRGSVASPQQVQDAVLETISAFGKLTAAVNNAGVECVRAPLHQQPEGEFDNVMKTNATGTFLCMKYELQQMIRQDPSDISYAGHHERHAVHSPEDASRDPLSTLGVRGAIVNVSSGAGLNGMPEFSPYAASKHAIVGLTRSAAVEYISMGIRINCVCPATTDTPMVGRFAQQWPDWQATTNASYPIGRIGSSEEVAEAIWWLITSPCQFVVGHTLDLGGGSTC